MGKPRKLPCPHDLCPKRFKSEGGREAHIQAVHSNTALTTPKKPRICYQCKAVFPSKVSREAHGKLMLHQYVEPRKVFEYF